MKKDDQKTKKTQKGEEQDLYQLMRNNLEMNKEIYEMLKSVKTYILLQRIWFGLKVLLILVPIVLGVIYLPPLVEDLFHRYQGLLPTAVNSELDKTPWEEAQEKEEFTEEEMQSIKEGLTSEQKEQLRNLLEE